MALNNWTILGRMTSDVELRSTQSGVSVCNFCVAVDRNYKKDEERITDWIDCVAWRGTAEFISKYFHKGDIIAIAGSGQTRNWEDQNGNKRKSVELLVETVSFAGARKESANEPQNTNIYHVEPDVLDSNIVTASDDEPF